MVTKVVRTGAVVCLVLCVGCSGVPPQQGVTLSGGSSISKPGISIYSGGASLQEGSMGVLYGPATSPEGLQKPRYIALVKFAPGKKIIEGWQFSSHSDGAHAAADATLVSNTAKLAFSYQVTGDPTSGQIKSEALSVNGKPANLGAGTLLLVDMSGPAMAWRQVQSELPPVPYQSNPQSVAASARDTLEILKRQSSEVRAFARP